MFSHTKVVVFSETLKENNKAAERLYVDTVESGKKMTQAILAKDFTTFERKTTTINLVEEIKNYIIEHDCPNLSMDVSHLNILDASKVTIICSTYHWSKYPNGKINWKIKSNEIKNLISPLNLGNINLITAQ